MTKKRPQKTAPKTAAETPRQRDVGPPHESFEDLDEWARGVAGCVSASELEDLVAIFSKMASDRRVSAENRRLARKQAQALRKCTEQ